MGTPADGSSRLKIDLHGEGNMEYLEGRWGFPETEDEGMVFYGQPARCCKCDHDKFQIVLITDLFGEQPVGMCDQCGTLHPILPPDG